MKLFKKIVSEALPVLIVSSFGAVIAGVIVNDISFYISILPGILILAPAVMSITDSVLGMFNSRVTSGIHDGDIDIKSFRNPVLKENILAILLITVIISIIIGIIAHYACIFLGYESMGLTAFILVAFLTHITSYTFMILVSLFIIFMAIKKKKDPDDIVAPLAPIVSDMGSMFFLLLTVKLVALI